MKLGKVFFGTAALFAALIGHSALGASDGLLGVIAKAESYEGFSYDVQYDGTLVITGCGADAEELLIPSEINGAAVTAIGDDAFYGNSSLKSVVISEGVKQVNFGAFENCAALKSVTIPKTAAFINSYAFNGCGALTDIYFGGTLEEWKELGLRLRDDLSENAMIHCSDGDIGDPDFIYYEKYDGTLSIEGFKNSESTECAVPETINGKTVTSVGESAFSGCAKLEKITLPDSVTSIGSYAFSDCAALKMLVFGGVKTIYDHAFKNCASLTSFIVPEDLFWLNEGLFEGCSSLKYVYIPSSASLYAESDIFAGCSSLETVYFGGTESNMQDIASAVPLQTNVISLEVKGAAAVSETGCSASLSWEKNSAAGGYQIERLIDDEWTLIAETDDVSYKVTGLAGGGSEKFRIRAKLTLDGQTLFGAYSSEIDVDILPADITDFKAQPTNVSITLSWNRSDGASGYEIQQYKSGEWETVHTVYDPEELTYFISGLSASKTFKFRIRAYSFSFWSELYGNWSDTLTVKTQAPINISKKAKIAPIKAADYTGEAIKPTLTVSYNSETLTEGNDYTVKYSSNKKPGTAYATVKFKGNYKGSKKASFKIKVGALKGLKAQTSGGDTVSLSWNAGVCDKYKVYRYNRSKKKYVLLGTAKEAYYSDENLSQLSSYKYKVKPVVSSGKKTYTGKARTVAKKTGLKAPEVTMTVKNKNNTVKWSVNPKADGYVVYRSAGVDDWFFGSVYNSYEKIAEIKNRNTVEYSDRTADNYGRYSYTVKAYRKSGKKKIFSDAVSTAKSLDTSNICNTAELSPHYSFEIINRQDAVDTSYTYTLSDNDIQILKKFAAEHFTSDMTRREKLITTLDWLNYNVKYARGDDWELAASKSYVEAAFVYKLGQCTQYNGAMVAMMVYLGYDANLIWGWRGNYPSSYHQHFWGEVNIGGLTYLMETGNFSDSGYWSYFMYPYQYTSGYIMNNQNVGGSSFW